MRIVMPTTPVYPSVATQQAPPVASPIFTGYPSYYVPPPSSVSTTAIAEKPAEKTVVPEVQAELPKTQATSPSTPVMPDPPANQARYAGWGIQGQLAYMDGNDPTTTGTNRAENLYPRMSNDIDDVELEETKPDSPPSFSFEQQAMPWQINAADRGWSVDHNYNYWSS